jgi:hypothetical protein
MQAAYRSAGVERYAAWVHESDGGMRAELSGRGYTIDETTRAMDMRLDDLSLAAPEVELGRPDWAEHLRIIDVPGLLSEADPSAFHILVAQLAGANVATAIAFDHDGDCGLFNVGTLEAARTRHGTHRASSPRRRRTWLLHREPAVHRHRRAGLRGGRLPRPRPHPRVRAVGDTTRVTPARRWSTLGP